jgi:hypothetical protein
METETNPKFLNANCSTCRANVQASIIGEYVISKDVEFGPGDWGPLFSKISLLACPGCQSAFVVTQGPASDEDIACDAWPEPQRVWPNGENTISYRVPPDIRADFLEAEKCLNCGVYTASVAMAGRALEGLVRSFTTPTTYLKDGIDKLHELDIIDDRLHKWGKAVHLERNEGAHASGWSYNEQDASDILEFSRAIIEYVFDIRRRFEKFEARRAKREAGSAKSSRGGDEQQA